jgi:hypothetical protein
MDAMNRYARALARLAVIAGVSTLALSVAPAVAATPCAERVIADWSDNGRIDGVYALDCYQSAIDAIPVDLRDYTNAADVISRALTEASRQDPPNGGAAGARSSDPFEAVPVADTSSASSVPLPLILVVVVSVLLLAAGLVGHLTRRHRASRPAEPAAD